MIFVTVGTQLPFPRLIDAMDALAPDLGEKIIAQIGPEPCVAQHLETHANLSPEAFGRLFTEARAIVAHAGIGTILSARRFGKPLILLPRRHALGEHRNDHQLATAGQVGALPGVHIAWEAGEIAPLLAAPDLAAASEAAHPNLDALIGRLSRFIAG